MILKEKDFYLMKKLMRPRWVSSKQLECHW